MIGVVLMVVVGYGASVCAYLDLVYSDPWKGGSNMLYRYTPEFRHKVFYLLAAGRSVASVA